MKKGLSLFMAIILTVSLMNDTVLGYEGSDSVINFSEEAESEIYSISSALEAETIEGIESDVDVYETEISEEAVIMSSSDDNDSESYQPQNFIGTKFIGKDVAGYIDFYESNSCVYMYIVTNSSHYALYNLSEYTFDNPSENTFACLLGNYEYGYESSSYYYGSSIRGSLNDDGTWSIKWTLSYGATIYNGTFIAQHTHTYDSPDFNWSDDYSSCIATFSCKAGDNEMAIDCDISSELSGTTNIYTASVTFNGVTYTDTQYIQASYFNITGNKYAILENDTDILYVNFALMDAEDDLNKELESIIWTSSDPNIAEVELDMSSGLYSVDMTVVHSMSLRITTYKPGLVTISGTDEYGRTASIDISVEPKMEISAPDVKKGSEITCSVELEEANAEYLDWYMENLSWDQEAGTASIVGETSWKVSDDGKKAVYTVKVTSIGLVSGISGNTKLIFVSYGGQEASEQIHATMACSMDYDAPEDEWSFSNYSDSPLSLTDLDYVALMSNLSESEISYWNGLIDKEGSGGVCYGMAVSSVLVSRDILSLNTVSSSISTLYEAMQNINTKSIIGFYQLNQFTTEAKNSLDAFCSMSVREQLAEIGSMTEPFVLGFGVDGWGAHALVGYGIEEGSWAYHNTFYTGRVLTYDPNYPYTGEQQDEGSYLYFNLDSCEWEIPNYYKYGATSKNESAYLKCAISDTNVMSNFSLELSRDAAHMLIYSVENSQNVQMIVNDSKTYSRISVLNSDETTLINVADGIMPDGSGTGVVTVDIKDASKCELISEDGENSLDVGILYDGYYLTALADSFESVAFCNDSQIELVDAEGDFTLGITADDPSIYYSLIEVSGSDSDEISIESTDDGIVVMSDDLNGLIITASNDENSVQTIVNSENESILIETDDYGNLICSDYVQSSGTCGDDLTWKLYGNGTLTITGTGVMTDWERASDTPWYDYRDSIEKVVIEEGVTTIGNEAFDECISLSEIVAGNSLAYIGQFAFWGCNSLESITFPVGLIGIGEYAFYSCQNLTDVTLPTGLTFIDTGAFSYCNKLKEITIPDSVVYLGDKTWAGETLWCCDTICGYTNTAAYWYAQRYNIAFESIGTLNEDDEYYISGNMVDTGEKGDLVNWILYEDGSLFFCGLGEMDDTNVGNSLSAALLYSYHSDITSVVITNGITSIGEQTFASGKRAGHGDIQFEKLTTVKIEDTILSIDDYAFYGCPSLQSVEIGSGVTSIGDYVFSYDYSLSQFIVDSDNLSFKVVDNILFSKDGTVLYRYVATSNNSYTVPYGTETIAIDAFGDCTSLESITIPVSMSQILEYAFDGCDNLANVYYEGTALDWAKIEVKDYNSSLENAAIHYAQKESIENSSFTVNVSESECVYTGSALTPAVSISYDGVALTEGTDYTVSYSNNINAGTAVITITGVGNYTGTMKKTFVIVKSDQILTAYADAASITAGKTASITASGRGAVTYESSDTSVATVSSNGLVTGIGAGTVLLMVTAAGDSNYNSASKTISITVTKANQTVVASVSSSSIMAGKTTTITASGIGMITYSSSDTSVATVDSNGKVTGKGVGTAIITVKAAGNNCYKSATKTVSIKVGLSTPVISSVKQSNKTVTVKWTKIAGAKGYYVYRSTSKNGTYTQVKKITSSTILSYQDAASKTNGKTYYYKIYAYSGTTKSSASSAKSLKYMKGTVSSLTNTSSGITVKWAKVSGATGYYIYRKASTASKYTLVTTVKKGATVSYTDTKIKSKNGTTYTYYVQPYNSSSKGAYSTKVTVRLTAVQISSLKNSSSKKMTLKWSKNSKATGYQIQYSTSSSFSSYKTVTVSGASSVSKTIGSLTKKKTYYVRIRAYKTVNGTKYYSAWSSKKSVKISK